MNAVLRKKAPSTIFFSIFISFFGCHTKIKTHSLPNYSLMAACRLLAQCNIQIASSSIWTRVASFISYDDNNYTTSASITTGAKSAGFRS